MPPWRAEIASPSRGRHLMHGVTLIDFARDDTCTG
jgi:hypothetical protein